MTPARSRRTRSSRTWSSSTRRIAALERLVGKQALELELPKGERYGPATTCYNRFIRWRKLGVWDRIFEAVSKAYDGDLQMVDSSSVRVHQHAANVKKGVPMKRRPPLGTSLQADAWGAREVD